MEIVLDLVSSLICDNGEAPIFELIMELICCSFLLEFIPITLLNHFVVVQDVGIEHYLICKEVIFVFLPLGNDLLIRTHFANTSRAKPGCIS